MADNKKTIAYTYLFNYFGGDTYEGKIIMGANVELAIRVYEKGKEVKFTEEPKKIIKWYFSDIYTVSFDRANQFKVEKNLYADNTFRILHNWDKIDFEVVSFSLDYLIDFTEEQKKNLPDFITEMPVSSPMTVTEEVFREFLRTHVDDFDISDNKNAQVPAYFFV